MMDIFPTHTCFDDALDLIAERLKGNPALARQPATVIALVHGILLAPEGPHKDEPFAHAWVEEGDEVWNSGLLDGQRIYYALNRDEWYRLMRLQKATRYSLREAGRENRKSGHYGPWAEEYRELCGDDGRVLGAITGAAHDTSRTG